MRLRFSVLCACLLLSGLALGCTAASPAGSAGSGEWTSIAQAPGAPRAGFTTPQGGSDSIASPAGRPQPAPAAPPPVQPTVRPAPAQPGPARPGAPQPPADFTFRFSVGDEVDVSIWREKELSATHRVLHDGTIAPPLLDPVRIEGMTIREVRSELLPKYKKYIKDPRISVRVVNVHSSRVFVLGEVAEAQAVVATGRMSALQAIAQAGGFEMEHADRERIRVVRVVGGKARVITVNADNVIAGRQRDVSLRPGDVVFVPTTGLSDWSRRLSQQLEPIATFLGSIGSIATTALAIDSLNN